MDNNQITNLLGALSVAIYDAQLRAITEVCDRSASDIAALMTLGTNPDISVTELAQILGLTHSAVVRLADRLSSDNLLERKVQADRREVGLRLTRLGKRATKGISHARSDALSQALEALTVEERATFGGHISKLLTHLVSSRVQADRLCRLCDEGACPKETCPVEARAVTIEAVT